MFNDFFLITSILGLTNILNHLCTLLLCTLMFTFPFVWTGLIWIIDFNSTSNNSSIYIVTSIRVITKLPNSEQSSKWKVKTHKYTNRQNQPTTGKLGKP